MIRVALTFLKGPAANAPAVLRRARPRPIACTIIRFVISLAAVRRRPTARERRGRSSRARRRRTLAAISQAPRANGSDCFAAQTVHDMFYAAHSFSASPGGRPRYAYSGTQ
jgi:hypothetical protein